MTDHFNNDVQRQVRLQERLLSELHAESERLSEAAAALAQSLAEQHPGRDSADDSPPADARHKTTKGRREDV